MHFLDILYCNARIYYQVLPDLQINLSGNYEIAVSKQRIIRKNTSGDRIFNSHYGCITERGICSGFYHILKPGAGQNISLFPKENSDCFLVKTSFISLDGHALNGVLHTIKKSRLSTGILLLSFKFYLLVNKSIPGLF